MLWKRLRFPIALLVVCGIVVLLSSGSSEGAKNFTRIHLENGGREPLTFLAIDTTETGVRTAENRLSGPLPPRAVYSAVLSRPGNYWVRTEVETEGYTIERVEGPLRLQRGVFQWQFTAVDTDPLYGGAETEAIPALAAPYRPTAGLISFRSN